MAKKSQKTNIKIITVGGGVVILLVISLLISKLSFLNNSLTENYTPSASPTIEPSLQRTKPTAITKNASKKGWVTYINSQYDYEIDVPSGSVLEQEGAYTRIQNYSSNDIRGLSKGDFYLEIYTNNYDSTDEYSCKEELVNPINANLSSASGQKGIMEPGGGESAPFRYALCIQKDSINFNVIASENALKYSQAIIDSFKFGK